MGVGDTLPTLWGKYDYERMTLRREAMANRQAALKVGEKELGAYYMGVFEAVDMFRTGQI